MGLEGERREAGSARLEHQPVFHRRSLVEGEETGAEELKSTSDTVYLVGDGYDIVKKALDSLGIKVSNTPMELRNENAASVGRAGLRKLELGECVSDLEISPIYLRMPQAE